jgi:hypothetical protein
MPSPTYYRQQAHRCLLLSRSTVDPQAKLWLTDMASYYAEKAKWIAENGVQTTLPVGVMEHYHRHSSPSL